MFRFLKFMLNFLLDKKLINMVVQSNTGEFIEARSRCTQGRVVPSFKKKR